MNRLLSVFICLLMLVSCGQSRRSAELAEIAAIVSDQPELALAKLDSVKLDDLNTADRHFYDFLTIKATDKAYITHESDSLICSVIEYYQARPNDELLPEVLYYGGRVYSDLGDAPQALDYYQQSLDRVPDTDLELRGRIVSQMAQLYYRHYQYPHAIEKVKESILIDEQLADTFGLAYDNKMLADIYLAKSMLDSAKICYSKALEISQALTTSDVAFMKVNLSYVLARQGRYKDAKKESPLSLLECIPEHLMPDVLSKYLYVYGNADEDNFIDVEQNKALISQYLEYDYIAAKSIGYGALADLDIATNNIDSLYRHLQLYKVATDSLNSTIYKDALIYQNSYFNYSLREKENHRLTKEKHNRDIIIVVFVFVLIIVCMVAAYLVKAHKHKRAKLELAISKMRQLDNDNTAMRKKLESVHDMKQELADLIQQRISLIAESEEASLPVEISGSQVYGEICKILDGELKNSAGKYWPELEKLIDKIHPKFKANLTTLLGTFSDHEYKICVLIKCGFTSTQVANLTFKSTSAISNSRARMSERAFGQKLGAIYWDKVIHSL